jgi:hypothetical protein
MRTILLFITITVLGSRGLQAQDLSQQFALTDEPNFIADAAKGDSLAPPPKRKLMPDNTSWFERGLWG